VRSALRGLFRVPLLSEASTTWALLFAEFEFVLYRCGWSGQ